MAQINDWNSLSLSPAEFDNLRANPNSRQNLERFLPWLFEGDRFKPVFPTPSESPTAPQTGATQPLAPQGGVTPPLPIRPADGSPVRSQPVLPEVTAPGMVTPQTQVQQPTAPSVQGAPVRLPGQEGAMTLPDSMPLGQPDLDKPPLPMENPIFDKLKRGSKGARVENLQRNLVDLGYDVGAIDGIFGGGVERALQQFQRDQGMKDSGVYDRADAEAMAAAPEALGREQDPRGEANEFTRGLEGGGSGDYSELYADKGWGYRQSQIVDHSHYNREPTAGGNSSKAGDASPEVQQEMIDLIIREGRAAGMSDEQIAYTLAIARHESGFNPDAAAGTTSAHGLGQFVDATGKAYGLTDEKRWDPQAQAKALVDHTLYNYKLADNRGYDEDYVYAFHHDGPSLKYGGLDISKKHIRPMVDKFLEQVTAGQGGPKFIAGVDQNPEAAPAPSMSTEELPATESTFEPDFDASVLSEGQVASSQKNLNVQPLPKPKQLGMIGGVRDGTRVWQSFGGSGMAHSSDYRDYSQLYREYTTTKKKGYVEVGKTEDGQTVYAAPDYLKDKDGNYVKVSKDDAIRIAGEMNALMPTRDWVKSAYSKATRVPMPTQPIYKTPGSEGDSALYTRKINEAFKKKGIKPGAFVVHGKEFFVSR